MGVPFATWLDVQALWRPLSDEEIPTIDRHCAVASAKLRQACPFDIDARIANFALDPVVQPALDPILVADVTANVVKRFLVNTEGVASSSDTEGPFSHSATYINRYDKTGSDVRGAIQVTDSDIDQLRPAVPSEIASSFRVGVPGPNLLIPHAIRTSGRLGLGSVPVIVPDIYIGSGTE